MFRQEEAAADVETAVEDVNDALTDSQHALNDGIAVATAQFNQMAAMAAQMGQQMMGAMSGGASAPPAARRIQQAEGVAELAGELTTDLEEVNGDAATIAEDAANVLADAIEQGNTMAGQLFGGMLPAMGGSTPAAPAAARRMQRF
jgi:hypothetical protein